MNQQPDPEPRPDEVGEPPVGRTSLADQSVSQSAYAELSAIMLESRPLVAVLRRIAELAVKTIPSIDDASVTLIDRGRPRTIAFCGQLAVTLDERQYEAGCGPCLDAARHGQTLLLDTWQEDGGYAEFAGRHADKGSGTSCRSGCRRCSGPAVG